MANKIHDTITRGVFILSTYARITNNKEKSIIHVLNVYLDFIHVPKVSFKSNVSHIFKFFLNIFFF